MTAARGKGMSGHQSTRMDSDTWLTPRHILAALGPFDLDPCSAPDPEAWPTAARHITAPQDGLAEDWEGRIWLNPPYGAQAAGWLARLSDHGTGTALIFARTETKMFTEHVWRGATSILFLSGRLHFHRADGLRAGANAGAPSCLVAYGRRDAAALASSGLDGFIVDEWRGAGR